MAVFTDSIGRYNLTIPTSADWTITAGLPNGDNYVQGDGAVDVTYNTNGSAFDLSVGDWTIEFWIYVGNVTSLAIILANTTTGSPSIHPWFVFIDTSEQLTFGLHRTDGAYYTQRQTAALSQSTWHYVVMVKLAGAAPVIYIDNTASSTAVTNPAGTAQQPGGSHRLWFGGQWEAGPGDLASTVRIAKLAIYHRSLNSDERAAHYAAMTT